LHDYLFPSKEEEDSGTAMFPGGRDLTPKLRVQALMRSMGRLTVASIRHVIDTRGRVTAGKMNGSIKSQDTEYDTEEIKNETHTSRILRKRDGTMCDYSAPLLMKRRAASSTDYAPHLTTMWQRLRHIHRVDDWRSYHTPCGIYMGQLLVRKKHGYRIVVRNPLAYSITLEVSIDRFPGTSVHFNRQPVASGMTTEIYLETIMERAIEALGTITIKWREWKREVVARGGERRRRRGSGGGGGGGGGGGEQRVVDDVDVGRCTVYLYAVSFSDKDYGSIEAELKSPAEQFKVASNAEPCPRNYLAANHPAHKFTIPGVEKLAPSPTRKPLVITLPSRGTARMKLQHLPTAHEPAGEYQKREMETTDDDFDERLKRGFLPHQRSEGIHGKK
jgi:hypothetical protein